MCCRADWVARGPSALLAWVAAAAAGLLPTALAGPGCGRATSSGLLPSDRDPPPQWAPPTADGTGSSRWAVLSGMVRGRVGRAPPSQPRRPPAAGSSRHGCWGAPPTQQWTESGLLPPPPPTRAPPAWCVIDSRDHVPGRPGSSCLHGSERVERSACRRSLPSRHVARHPGRPTGRCQRATQRGPPPQPRRSGRCPGRERERSVDPPGGNPPRWA